MSEYICCADGDLKPCPVCGGKNTILMNTRGDDWDDSIDCPDCGMSFTGFETAEELIKVFNTRYERTCHMDRQPATIEGSIGYLTCSFCDCGFDYTEEPFNCMNCGAKVVDE